MGKIPKEKEQFETECGGYLFQVASVDNKMISRVKAVKIQQNGAE